MILLVDIGNTALKWATCDEHGLAAGSRLLLSGRNGVAELLAQEWSKLERPQRIVAASVRGGGAADELAAWTEAFWQLQPEFVASQAAAFGVRNSYPDCERLGVDRWAVLVAARRRIEGFACIIDCGTAVTVDVMDGSGQHQGGLIVPGLDLMAKALQTNTRVDLRSKCEPHTALFATDTESAVSGGTTYALVAFLDRVVADVAATTHQTPTVLITGGDAPRLLPLLSASCQHVPDLVLEGLAIMAGEAP